MCGIAGLITSGRGDAHAVCAMIDALVHRGPDDQGVWLDAEAGVGLGNRRLAIIDLSPAGSQPMQSCCGRFVISFNGEIYNHTELRAELEAKGAVPERGWRGHSDTETLLQAIVTMGLRPMLDCCVGMYAFALWDREERKLSLVRDRFGEKPLYYGWAGGDFVFASELKAIRTHPRFDPSIDRRALRLFVSRGYVPAPLSIHRGIYKLEPGCILEFSARAAGSLPADPPIAGFRAGGFAITRYWSYRDLLTESAADPIEHEGEALYELERALARAVQSQSITDVPVGAFLSGGLDSSAIVALYQKHSARAVRTFTIGFDDKRFDEADHARAVAKHFGTEHHEKIVTPREALEVIPRLPHIYDEPFADSSQIPTYLVSAFAREQVKVALSGDGGDELFGGYNRYFGTARLWSSLKRLPAPVRRGIAGSGALVPAVVWDGLAAMLTRRTRHTQFGAKVRRSLFSVAGAGNLEHLFVNFIDDWPTGSPVLDCEARDELGCFNLDAGPGAPDALRMMYADTISYLPDDILCKVDRASMAVSLETHAPYLDHRVAGIAARIPLRLKIQGGSGKHILRRLLYREAPRELFDRPKLGFAVPVGEWIKGPLRDWAEDLLDTRSIACEGWLDADLVERRWEEHRTGRSDSTSAIWTILMFQAWLREQRLDLTAAA